jgi:hypothetical protein
MKTTKDNLYRIILEEYLKEGGLQISESKVDDLIAHIKGGPRPDWMGDDERKIPPPPAVPPTDIHGAETQAFPPPDDIPSDDAPESEYSGFQDRHGPPVEDQLAALIQGMDPEAVAELFQSVFEKIPGVEMDDAEEEAPETLYSPGAEGRPVAGFQLEELMGLIREVLDEGHYHDMGDDDEMYDALDPHGFDKMSDHELIDAMHTDGMEDMIIRDGEGGIVNRKDVIAALKNV